MTFGELISFHWQRLCDWVIPSETQTSKFTWGEDRMELVTHEVQKYCGLLRKGNGNVLEELSVTHPLLSSPEFYELQAIAQRGVSRSFASFYLGKAFTALRDLRKNVGRNLDHVSLKTLLHIYRDLLAGSHLMRAGEVVSDLTELSRVDDQWDYLRELIAVRREQPDRVVQRHERQYHFEQFAGLMAGLEQARDESKLPAEFSQERALADWLYHLRLSTVAMPEDVDVAI